MNLSCAAITLKAQGPSRVLRLKDIQTRSQEESANAAEVEGSDTRGLTVAGVWETCEWGDSVGFMVQSLKDLDVDEVFCAERSKAAINQAT